MTDFLSCCKWIRVKAVITDKYVEKAKKMPSDEKVYEVLKKDSTNDYKRKLVNILTRLKMKKRSRNTAKLNNG